MEKEEAVITIDSIMSVLKELKEQGLELTKPVLVVQYNISERKWEICMKPLTLYLIETYAVHYVEPTDAYAHGWVSPIYLFNNLPEANHVIDILNCGDVWVNEVG